MSTGESLRDGRRVIGPDGKEIEDVTSDVQLAPGIDRIAEYYDAHFANDSKGSAHLARTTRAERWLALDGRHPSKASTI